MAQQLKFNPDRPTNPSKSYRRVETITAPLDGRIPMSLEVFVDFDPNPKNRGNVIVRTRHATSDHELCTGESHLKRVDKDTFILTPAVGRVVIRDWDVFSIPGNYERVPQLVFSHALSYASIWHSGILPLTRVVVGPFETKFQKYFMHQMVAGSHDMLFVLPRHQYVIFDSEHRFYNNNWAGARGFYLLSGVQFGFRVELFNSSTFQTFGNTDPDLPIFQILNQHARDNCTNNIVQMVETSLSDSFPNVSIDKKVEVREQEYWTYVTTSFRVLSLQNPLEFSVIESFYKGNKGATSDVHDCGGPFLDRAAMVYIRSISDR